MHKILLHFEMREGTKCAQLFFGSFIRISDAYAIGHIIFLGVAAV